MSSSACTPSVPSEGSWGPGRGCAGLPKTPLGLSCLVLRRPLCCSCWPGGLHPTRGPCCAHHPCCGGPAKQFGGQQGLEHLTGPRPPASENDPKPPERWSQPQRPRLRLTSQSARECLALVCLQVPAGNPLPCKGGGRHQARAGAGGTGAGKVKGLPQAGGSQVEVPPPQRSC